MQASARQQLALSIALEAAQRACTIMRDTRAQGLLNVSTKKNNHRDLVTAADTQAEKEILDLVANRWTEPHAFLSEETNADTQLSELGQRSLWIVDPIDGTVNYARGHLHSAVSIAVAWGGALQVGVVASPFENEIFHAIRGAGAYCNNTPIRPRSLEALSAALVATGFPVRRDAITVRALVNRFETLLPEIHDFRRAGAASLDVCWVACGRLDAYYEDVSAWDIAAGSLIASEAGALVGHYDSGETAQASLADSLRGKHYLVSTAGIFRQITEKLRMTIEK